ncbi:MAG: hypothetical protein HY903_03750, partial [Deltaproteobacteria bacterium]|nr:hypothetical protein [Deltaproteobacteria bacterium]
CGSFPTRDLSFAGAYLPHAGQTMYAALVREIDSRLVASTSTVVPAGGAVSLPLAGRLQDGLSYRWDYFADTNADGLCTGPSFVEDHAWQIQVPEVDGNVILSRDHDTAFAAVCASF